MKTKTYNWNQTWFWLEIRQDKTRIFPICLPQDDDTDFDWYFIPDFVVLDYYLFPPWLEARYTMAAVAVAAHFIH